MQVLKHGCPIAWKSGSPFGIILHCSYRDFILLCDAFGQGRLTLDEDLELYHLMSEWFSSTFSDHFESKRNRISSDMQCHLIFKSLSEWHSSAQFESKENWGGGGMRHIYDTFISLSSEKKRRRSSCSSRTLYSDEKCELM